MKRFSVPKWLLIAAGVLSLGLAAVGVFIPVLPTTPFLLLAAACFVRSSDRLYHWLTTHRVFGAYIKNYREHRAVTRQTKIVTLVALWGTIGITVLSTWGSHVLHVVLLMVAAGVTAHVLSLKTLTPEMLAQQARDAEGTEDAARAGSATGKTAAGERTAAAVD